MKEWLPALVSVFCAGITVGTISSDLLDGLFRGHSGPRIGTTYMTILPPLNGTEDTRSGSTRHENPRVSASMAAVRDLPLTRTSDRRDSDTSSAGGSSAR